MLSNNKKLMFISKKYITESNTRIIIFLFLTSLAVRLCFLLPVAIFKTPLINDENWYFIRVLGFEKIISGLLGGKLPSAQSLAIAYGKGRWPPLHPFLLAMGAVIMGKQIYILRLVVTLFSSLTTPLVYLITRKLSTKRASFAAAFIHILYPSFIAYSHYIWSETTFIFFLLLSIYFSITAQQSNTKKSLYAVLCGLFLGLSGLTRAAALPFIIFIPLWFLVYLREKRLSCIIITVSFIVLLPWEITVMSIEKRPVFISSKAGLNLYIGNNPWVPEKFGSSWLHPDNWKKRKAFAEEYAKKKSIKKDIAQRELALQEIRQNFKGFLLRCVYRVRMLWTCDFFLLRHIFRATYPPMPYPVVYLIWGIVIISYIAFVWLTISGFLCKKEALSNRKFIIALVVAGAVPATLSIAMSRLHIPLMAILLPVAGHGASKRIESFRRVVSFMLTALFCVLIYPTIPMAVSVYFRISSYYSGMIRDVDKVIGSKAFLVDNVIFRVRGSDSLRIATRGKYNFLPSEPPRDNRFYRVGGKECVWKVSPRNSQLALSVSSKDAERPPKMSIYSTKLGKSTIIQPIQREYWHKWRKSELDGVEYMWAGGTGLSSTFMVSKTVFSSFASSMKF